MTAITNLKQISQPCGFILHYSIKAKSRKTIMNTATTYYQAGTAPATITTPYLANVFHAARALLTALFAVRPARAAATAHDRADLMRLARSYRDSAPSLSQELAAIACRDDV